MKREFIEVALQVGSKVTFESVTIKVASPHKIRSWSFGEIKKPGTLSYRTAKPEWDGLFCCKIFGPLKDYECFCGRYKFFRSKGIVCERCGVEVIPSKVRRERMAHITLATPVSHIWFLKTSPQTLSAVLNLSSTTIERLLYYEACVMIGSEPARIPLMAIVSDEDFINKGECNEGCPESKTGAEAIKHLLKFVDIEEELAQMEERLEVTVTQQRNTTQQLLRLEVLRALRATEVEPEWMILDVIPVLPPDLRPMIPLGEDKFITSDLNDLYKKIINRNNRLKRLLELEAPKIVVQNEKRMLQEAVDCLIDNGRRGSVAINASNRPLRSLTEMLKGKTGRFRQNLLGKRVDYSGRSVITVGPSLRVHQCGIPKLMAIELFRPFLYNKLLSRGVINIKIAKERVNAKDEVILELLTEITKSHPVLLNRAPTLHRLSVQAFEPVIIEGKAIRLHPLVCSAFNADFDGDQMAVHIPLSLEAQMEAKVLMLSTSNLLLPTDGRPSLAPTQEAVLGLYFSTKRMKECKRGACSFIGAEDVKLALLGNAISFNTIIKARASDCVKHRGVLREVPRTYYTTASRRLLREIIPSGIPFGLLNCTLRKRNLSDIICLALGRCEMMTVVHFIEKLASYGFGIATEAGISLSANDFRIPETKDRVLFNVMESIRFNDRKEKVGETWEGCCDAISVWSKVASYVKDAMLEGLQQHHQSSPKLGRITNSVYMMADSGARGSTEQIRQITAMRGLMVKPDGSILETPITANFKEGLSTLQYFISAHGARKGLADTALKTANSGYLTRRLADVSQDVVITGHDCNTHKGLRASRLSWSNTELHRIIDCYLGRFLSEHKPVKNTDHQLPISMRILEEYIDKNSNFVFRSPITCSYHKGICSQCYGNDVSTTSLVNIGEAVGIVAAQSIGEPGTQLTMRTFHIGGTASYAGQSDVRSRWYGYVLFDSSLKLINTPDNRRIAVSRFGVMRVIDRSGAVIEAYEVPYGSVLTVSNYANVTPRVILFVWDQRKEPIVSEVDGTLQVPQNNITFRAPLLPQSSTQPRQPTIILKIYHSNQLRAILTVANNAILTVSNNQRISVGQVIGYTALHSGKSEDITGGLLQIADIFEVRVGENTEILSELLGTIAINDSDQDVELVVTSGRLARQRIGMLTGREVMAQHNQLVRKGDTIIGGDWDPCGILKLCGIDVLVTWLIREIQNIYKSQDVNINSKHIEVIIRQMLRFAVIMTEGNTRFFAGEQIERSEVIHANQEMRKLGKQQATYELMLMGITRSSLAVKSFISAASFQETSKVLAKAASLGGRDVLCGLKENVIVGRMIPAGTGFMYHQYRKGYANN